MSEDVDDLLDRREIERILSPMQVAALRLDGFRIVRAEAVARLPARSGPPEAPSRKRFSAKAESAGPRIGEVITATCEVFELTRDELLSRKRIRAIARPRQIGMAAARELTRASLPMIGIRFGGLDHTTVIHAIDRVAELIAADDEDVAAGYRDVASLARAARDRRLKGWRDGRA